MLQNSTPALQKHKTHTQHYIQLTTVFLRKTTKDHLYTLRINHVLVPLVRLGLAERHGHDTTIHNLFLLGGMVNRSG